MEITQIVPSLPPSIDGVGDYAFLLARELRLARNVLTRFVVCDSTWGQAEMQNQKSQSQIDGFPVYQLKERTAVELVRVLNQPGMPSKVLLQYVGYGYQKRGCPLWLAKALRLWKTTAKSASTQFPASGPRRLVTMFHELYASGKPWQSSFWTSPLQQWIVKDLARLSDHCVTNLRRNIPVLQRLTDRDDCDFKVLPVFSNVGELESLTDWNLRKPRMIVFGSASQRRKVYFEHVADLERACQNLGLTEIVDIGAPIQLPSLSVRLERRGILAADKVSQELSSAKAGFFAYPAGYLGKSGIFAAYAAHGLAPVTFSGNNDVCGADLKPGEHFIFPENSIQQLRQTGAKIREWYDYHSLKANAVLFANKIQI